MALMAQSRQPAMGSFPSGGSFRARQSPALTSDDLPDPEGPETTSRLPGARSRRVSMRAAVSSSRPKKRRARSRSRPQS
ncbi:hypothetical protein THSYN_13645 [Candidatus Thiodictyon syntrophicum]|uniref:Uncharacterized protein n=1 Tax=Candidatus Thiodictyon syntrophicum TaxID=1166950 RepID=A0A2K8U8L9_9GAMM|nr:hypothetical protein THSYN_13645 [Candidatus Thiodictyon syntrophicum]